MLFNLPDVGIAEQQKGNKKRGRDCHIKQLSIQPPTGIIFHNMRKICVGFFFIILNIKNATWCRDSSTTKVKKQGRDDRINGKPQPRHAPAAKKET